MVVTGCLLTQFPRQPQGGLHEHLPEETEALSGGLGVQLTLAAGGRWSREANSESGSRGKTASPSHYSRPHTRPPPPDAQGGVTVWAR